MEYAVFFFLSGMLPLEFEFQSLQEFEWVFQRLTYNISINTKYNPKMEYLP